MLKELIKNVGILMSMGVFISLLSLLYLDILKIEIDYEKLYLYLYLILIIPLYYLNYYKYVIILGVLGIYLDNIFF